MPAVILTPRRVGLWCLGALAACGARGEEAALRQPDRPADVVAIPDAGEEVYSRVCVTCHQAGGEGLPGTFPPLAESPVVTGPAEVPIKIVLHGLVGPINRGGSAYDAEMAPWGMALTDQDVADVLTFVRARFGNSAPAVTPDAVAAVRAETVSRNSPFSTEELGIVH